MIAAARAAAAGGTKSPATAGSEAAKPGGTAAKPSAKTTGDIENLLDDTAAAVSQAQIDAMLGNAAKPPVATPAPKPYEFDDLQGQPNDEPPHSMDLLGDVELDLRIELGRTVMRLEEVLRLRGGSVVALDKLAGDPVDIYINGRLIAHGEVLVMNDNFCIRVTELVGSSARPGS
ncbi:MAG TPA: flagellar motor switch protein FliN [Planctomycetaceae bacterium]|nr:flagellar motor switch protein FliN [Planctomycetaceae bacterium]